MTAPMRSRTASWTAPVARGEQAEYQAQDQGRDGERDPNGDAGEVGHAPAPGPRVPSFPLAVEAPAALDYGPVARHHVALEPTGFGYDHARSARRRCARRPRSRGRRRSARSRHFGSCRRPRPGRRRRRRCRRPHPPGPRPAPSTRPRFRLDPRRSAPQRPGRRPIRQATNSRKPERTTVRIVNHYLASPSSSGRPRPEVAPQLEKEDGCRPSAPASMTHLRPVPSSEPGAPGAA
jgi:hypothetical protein